MKVKVTRMKAMPTITVADRDRRFVEVHDLTRRILDMLGQDEVAYFEAERGLGQWEIGERVSDEDW
jgi:hypothetical protein